MFIQARADKFFPEMLSVQEAALFMDMEVVVIYVIHSF